MCDAYKRCTYFMRQHARAIAGALGNCATNRTRLYDSRVTVLG
jgi:hypothetical protein